MIRSFTQKEIYQYLLANPLNTKVHIGDLEDMNGEDYIFLDYANDVPMLRDNEADYQSIIQISVLTNDFEDRKTLVNYIKQKFLIAPVYSRSDESHYYMAQFTTGVFLSEEY
jgi:hypothetical protein